MTTDQPSGDQLSDDRVFGDQVAGTAAAIAPTRASLHAVAEHVLAAARYQATGRIGLTVTPGGFATPPFGDEARSVGVEGVDVVVRVGGAEVAREPLTTIRAAATLAGITPGGPAEVYRLNTPGDPDRPLDVDPEVARRLAEWYSFGNEALRRWSVEIAATDEPSGITLWPEHADVALRAAEINYGVSLGDEYVPAPYLYVGPPLPPPSVSDGFWNISFGAFLTWDDVSSAAGAVGFFRRGRQHARR